MTALRGFSLGLILVVAWLIWAVVHPASAGYAAGAAFAIVIQGAILLIPLLGIAGLWWWWRRHRP